MVGAMGFTKHSTRIHTVAGSLRSDTKVSNNVSLSPSTFLGLLSKHMEIYGPFKVFTPISRYLAPITK